MPNGFGSQDNPYVEFPFDRVIEVHWKKVEGGPLGTGQCTGFSGIASTQPPANFETYTVDSLSGFVQFSGNGLECPFGHNWSAQVYGNSGADHPNMGFTFEVTIRDFTSGVTVGSSGSQHALDPEAPWGPLSLAGAWGIAPGANGGGLEMLLAITGIDHDVASGGVECIMVLTALP